MTAPEIRPMQPADLDAVLAIAAACPEAPRWQPSSYTPYFADPEPPLLRAAFVATLSGRIVGFAAATLLLDPPGAANPENRCELDSMAVVPDARRLGIGAALLQQVLNWAATHDCRRFTLEVRASNTAAIRLYERDGLRREGLRPRYYTDPTDDAVLLGAHYPRDLKSTPFSTAKAVEGGLPRC
jgi:ribosomal-protein-alanine N-acetyltransferase